MTEHGGAGHQLLEDHPTVVRFDLFADADEPLTLLNEGGVIPGVVAEVGERDREGNLDVSVEGGGEGIQVSRDLSDRLYAGAP
jgi:hypothetical protein